MPVLASAWRVVADSALNRARIAGIEGGLQVTALERNVPVVGLAVVHSVALVRGARPLDEGVFPHVEIFEREVPLGRQDLGKRDCSIQSLRCS